MAALLNRSIRKAVLITPEADEKLKKVATDKNLSQNDIINKALDAYLARFK
ncbi:MAG: hypothetical protein U0L26_09940 [Cellulosilyticum sp.]|nr:hypothetical protein [Cellulosilyticum sp.]